MRRTAPKTAPFAAPAPIQAPAPAAIVASTSVASQATPTSAVEAAAAAAPIWAAGGVGRSLKDDAPASHASTPIPTQASSAAGRVIDASGNLVASVAVSAAATPVINPTVDTHFASLPADSGVRLDAGGVGGGDVKRCPHCDKDIPTANFSMHELRCARNAAYHKVRAAVAVILVVALVMRLPPL